jgi:hypothetical protein
MITVGLDFGTHQTKVCIEDKKGVELNYSFFKFMDIHGNMQYTLPSIIHIDPNGYLSYGYIPHSSKGKIIRYFKQSTFTKANSGNLKSDSIYHSIWYIAFILFHLEEKYNQEFVIQMGVPTDSIRFDQQKQLAVSILASAYHLVETVFENDKKAFLNSSVTELKLLTEIKQYSKELKNEYGMLIFPEAYACLMPLISSSKITTGMSLMVDIGGGTTDISFFTIQEGFPQVYDFKSLDKGLNFLTDAEKVPNFRLDSNLTNATEILIDKKKALQKEINHHCVNLISRLQKEFKKQCDLRIERLSDALKTRPIIYTGGGSSFEKLRMSFGGFRDVIHISEKEWRAKSISELNVIKSLGLCPILSTSYGLSISVPNDDIICEPFRDLFAKLRGAQEESPPQKTHNKFGTAISEDGFNYMDDYDAYK